MIVAARRAVRSRGHAVRAASLSVLLGALIVPLGPARAGATIHVPEDFASIQEAIDSALPGNVIDIAPGVYTGPVTVDVPVTLRGRDSVARAPRKNTTILDGGGSTVVRIPEGVSPAPSLVGLTIRDGDDGISVRSPTTIRNCYFASNVDSLDYELGGGGVIRRSVFDHATDDGIDVDHLVRDLKILHNRIYRSADDGIEMRLQDDAIDETAQLTVSGNQIVGSREDGVQIIDYAGLTDRLVVIDGNLIRDTAMAGVGLMNGGKTIEDYRAASVAEPVFITHTTFVANHVGVSGGGSVVAVDNIFDGHALALKGLDRASIASYNLFWDNTTDAQDSALDLTTSLFADPRLSARYRLLAGSPAIDAGTAAFTWNGVAVVDQSPSSYRGSAPDLGWLERS